MNMSQSEIIEQLKPIVEPYVQDAVAFKNMTPETDLLNDLKINSANLVDIILDIEDAFDVEVDDDSADIMLTVQEAVDVIEKLLAEKG